MTEEQKKLQEREQIAYELYSLIEDIKDLRTIIQTLYIKKITCEKNDILLKELSENEEKLSRKEERYDELCSRLQTI